MTWKPVWALPNISLDNPVESRFFAFVPYTDRRVRRIARQHPEFRKFMARFTDTFKNRIKPSLIICRTDTPEHLLASEAIASIRDILVASVVPHARSRNIIYDNVRSRIAYSSFFWIYPWMIDRNYEYIIASTPVMLAIHEAGAFKGQSSPDLSPTTIRRTDFDEPLLQELLHRWGGRYDVRNPKWENIALFRSLNMANQASLIPAGADATLHDFGRMIGLWVASFEILVHPGGNGRANLLKVFELFGRIPWIDKRCGYRLYETGTSKSSFRRNLACWLYKQLYGCRNNFLHGNPVGISNLLIRQSGRSLISLAPILYRLGLTSFLDLSWKEQAPPLDDVDALGKYVADKMQFIDPQRDAERALRLARVSPEQERERRDAARRQRRRQGFGDKGP